MKKIDIVVPMAGNGSRFSIAGYNLPKPLLDVDGEEMMFRAIESIKPKRHEYRFIFIVQSIHCKLYEIDSRLRNRYPDCFIVTTQKGNNGSAITILSASSLIYNNPVIVSVCDAIQLIDIDDFIDNAEYKGGLMATFEDKELTNKWCYTKLEKEGGQQIKEKCAISTHASTGVWYFKSGLDLLRGIIDTIYNKDKVNDEYYVTMAYNYIKNVDIYPAGFIPLGVPEELESYRNKTHKEYK